MIEQSLQILLVEDTLPLARTYESYLSRFPGRVISVPTAAEARSEVNRTTFDVILLDIRLPDEDGISFLTDIREDGCESAVVMITADGSIDQAVEAIRLGADDYLVKPISANRLVTTISNTVEKQDLKKKVATYQQAFDRGEYCGFIGSSLPMQAIYRTIDSAASSNATIFIKGESGTGKELMAQAIHEKSSRTEHPFVAINCAAIPSELMESEIFGHVKGAFTGAQQDRTGAALKANKGTLFLDEICEMDLALQAKLLRFIQTGSFSKVGSDTLEKVDLRFVCATNRDPLTEVEAGRFREDLFYRLHIIPVTLPPLRERGTDVQDLAEFFLRFYNNEEGKGFTGFDETALALLKAHKWPGNVRELQNVMQRIIVLNEGDIISSDMLPTSVINGSISVALSPQEPQIETPVLSEDQSVLLPMWKLEQEHIRSALKMTDNNVPQAAAMLQISPSTIYRKLKETS